MRPYTICHMMASVDGRIDCDMTEKIEDSDVYYDALRALDCPTMLMGRVTMQMHYAGPDMFKAADLTPIGREAFHRAAVAEGYLVAVDTHGALRWPQSEFDGRPLLVLTSEECPKEYLDTLTAQHISWIATGRTQIDLPRAMAMLTETFGVQRLSVTGGGHINAAFLRAGLLDEVSVMYAPGIDGRGGMTAVFDGIDHEGWQPVRLTLTSVSQTGGTVWLRYTL